MSVLDFQLVERPFTTRMMHRLVPTAAGCIEWGGFKDSAGYGKVTVDKVPLYAHRVAYEFVNGPIADGLVIDHLCSNPSCVNPSHLEAVPQRTNVHRGRGLAAANARKTHCPKGHPYSGANLRVTPQGSRACRECERTKSREQQRRRRARKGSS